LHTLRDWPLSGTQFAGAGTIYHVAAILDVIYIVTASFWELYSSFGTNRQVAQ